MSIVSRERIVAFYHDEEGTCFQLTEGMLCTLNALVERGPVHCDNIPVMSSREDLIDAGLAIGDGDYTAATTKGRTVYIDLWGQGSDDINHAIAMRKSFSAENRKESE